MLVQRTGPGGIEALFLTKAKWTPLRIPCGTLWVLGEPLLERSPRGFEALQERVDVELDSAAVGARGAPAEWRGLELEVVRVVRVSGNDEACPAAARCSERFAAGE